MTTVLDRHTAQRAKIAQVLHIVSEDIDGWQTVRTKHGCFVMVWYYNGHILERRLVKYDKVRVEK